MSNDLKTSEVIRHPKWTESVEDKGWSFKNVFAWAFWDSRHITVLKYKWCPWWIYKNFVLPHEYSHTWGIEECFNKDKGCIMFEGTKNRFFKRDTWREKLVIPFQIWHRIRHGSWFCNSCASFLQDNMKD